MTGTYSFIPFTSCCVAPRRLTAGTLPLARYYSVAILGGRGPVPNAKQRAQMVRYIESLPPPA